MIYPNGGWWQSKVYQQVATILDDAVNSEVSHRTDSFPMTFERRCYNWDVEVSCAFLMSRRDKLWSGARTKHIQILRFVLKAEMTLPLSVART
jgi:hypothetical protein